jgi:hypothetical protein
VRYSTTEIVNGVPERKQKSHRLRSKNRATVHGPGRQKAWTFAHVSPVPAPTRRTSGDLLRWLNLNRRTPSSIKTRCVLIFATMSPPEINLHAPYH